MKLFKLFIILVIVVSCSDEQPEVFSNENKQSKNIFPAPTMMSEEAFPIINYSQFTRTNNKKATTINNAELRPAIYNDKIWENTENGIDVVFIMEGFTSDEEPKFYIKANELIESMHEKTPFSSNTQAFNFWTYNSISVESGISIRTHKSNPLNPITKNTAWGVYRNRIGLARYTDLPKSKLKALKKIMTHPVIGYFNNNVYTVIIVNDEVYAGSGEFKKENSKLVNAIVTTSEQFSVNTFKALFLHEFGHSFGDLDDEYQHQPTYDRIKKYEIQLFNLKRKLNTSEDDITDRKWDGLVSNPIYIKGSRWGSTEYRSSPNSLMRSVVISKPFGELNEILLQDRINASIGQ